MNSYLKKYIYIFVGPSTIRTISPGLKRFQEYPSNTNTKPPRPSQQPLQAARPTRPAPRPSINQNFQRTEQNNFNNSADLNLRSPSNRFPGVNLKPPRQQHNHVQQPMSRDFNVQKQKFQNMPLMGMFANPNGSPKGI